MRTLLLLLTLTLTLVLPGALPVHRAQASVVRALSLEEMVARADHIVIAVPEEKQSRRGDDGRMIVTDVSLRVQRVLKGKAKRDGVLVATCLGGRLETIALQVPGEATFAIGERAIVFLRDTAKGKTGAGGTAQEHLRVLGMSQGVMPITEEGATTMVLPGGGHAALVQRGDDGKLGPAGSALSGPTPLDAVLARIAALLAGQPTDATLAPKPALPTIPADPTGGALKP